MPTDKRVWYNAVERDAFIERTCARCFQVDEAQKRLTGDGPGCPHLARAEQNKLPHPWTRRRNAVMGDTYRCAEFAPKAPVNRRPVVEDETPPMLEIDNIGCTKADNGDVCLCDDVRECGNAYPKERHPVPVDGWPDFRGEQRKPKKGDHA